MKMHSVCKDGSYEAGHLLSKRSILITPVRAAEDLSIKADRSCNSQITPKRPPWAFLSVSTHNKCNLCLYITSFHQSRENTRISLRKPSLVLSVYKKTLDLSGALGHCGGRSRQVGALLEWQGRGEAWVEDEAGPGSAATRQAKEFSALISQK